MSLPWLQDDYKRPESNSRSRSRSGSRSRRPKSEESRGRRSRSRSLQRGDNRNMRGRGGRRGDRSTERSRRKRSRSSSSASSSESRTSTTRLVASSRPKYVNARIFVASISSKDLSKSEIVTHFEKYGNVVDCLIHPKNYIFVQYLKEEHARLAVEGENGSTFNGFKLDVKMARENRKAGGQHAPNRDNSQNRDDGGPNEGRPPRDRDHPFGPDPFMHDRRHPPGFPPPPGGDFGMRDHYFPPDPYRRGYPPEPWLPPDDPFRRDPRDPFPDPYRDPYAARPPPPPVPVAPVECEVFIISPQQRNYGEMIERRVRDQSIISVLSLLPEGRTAPQMVEELTVKGALFAIFLNAQNESHRSLTLNILHGTPQEHRNMPLDDAISLIGRSFEKYVEELRVKANAKTAAAAADAAASSSSSVAVSRVFLTPSSEVTYLLNLLADNRALTVAELDTVIKYLQERRDKLVDADKRPSLTDENEARKFAKDKERESSVSSQKNAPESYIKESCQQTHKELTKKILSIFQGVDPTSLIQSSGSVSQVPAPQPAPPPQAKTSTSGANSGANLINFDNPNVQKALDNLIQSGPSLLKTFSSSSSSKGPAPSKKKSKINSAPPVGDEEEGMGGRGRMHGPGEVDGPHSSGMGMMGMGGMDMQSMYEMQHAAMAAAAMAPYNMPMGPGMIHMGGPMAGGRDPMGPGMGAMGGPDYNNYPTMPQGGPPPPPPPNQRY